MRCLTFLLLLLVGCSNPPQAGNSIGGNQAADVDTDDSFSPSEKDTVRRQIEKNWKVDPGMPGLETMEVLIIVEMNPDGSIRSARLDPASIRDDPNWNHFAQTCLRAVVKASPLKMPPDKPYAAWKTMTLRFNARDLMRPS
jgi:TonB C terminal